MEFVISKIKYDMVRFDTKKMVWNCPWNMTEFKGQARGVLFLNCMSGYSF